MKFLICRVEVNVHATNNIPIDSFSKYGKQINVNINSEK